MPPCTCGFGERSDCGSCTAEALSVNQKLTEAVASAEKFSRATASLLWFRGRGPNRRRDTRADLLFTMVSGTRGMPAVTA